MKLNKTIKKIHIGWQLGGYSVSLLTENDIKQWCKRLERIPFKITCFVDRTTIKRAYKEDEFLYYVVGVDNKLYVLDY